jgi:hypothetical protein
MTERDKLRESLAEYAHEAWSGWMKYMLPRLSLNSDNVDTLRWRRQMLMEYRFLSEDEKESDRKEADRILSIIEEKQEDSNGYHSA